MEIYVNIAITGSGFSGNDETHKETQGQANHESRETTGLGFAAPHPSTGPEATPEEIIKEEA